MSREGDVIIIKGKNDNMKTDQVNTKIEKVTLRLRYEFN